MGNYIREEKKINKRIKVNNKAPNSPVNLISIIVLLAFGYITVLTPNLDTLNSSGPKFLALAILNLLVWSYLVYRERNSMSKSHFGSFFKTKLGVAYSILILLSLLSFTKSINVVESIVSFSKIFTIFTSTWIISIFLLKDKSTIKYLAIGMVGLMVFDSLRVFYETYQYIQGDIGTISLIKAGYSNKNILAASLFIKLPFALWLLTFEKGWLRIFGIVSIFIGFIAVLFMSSRAFYIGLIIVSVLYGTFLIIRYFQTKNKIFFKNGAVYFSSLILAFIIFSIVQNFYYPHKEDRYNASFSERLSTVTVNEQRNARLKFWGWTVDLIKENPVLGVGSGNWKIVILERENLEKANFTYMYKVHNDFLEITAESGLIAGFLFISMFVIVFFLFVKTIFQAKFKGADRYFFLPAFGLLTYMFDAFFNFPHDRPQIQALFALYVAMGVAFSFEFFNNTRGNSRKIKFGVKLDKKWVWPILSFVILLISATGYILALNFKSLKIQRIYKEEEVTGMIKTNSTYYINQFPSIPNLSSTGVPLNLQIAKKLVNEKQYRKVKDILRKENLSPFDSRREYFLSYTYFELKNIDSALYFIQQAHNQKPLNFEYIELYCKILESLGMEDDAISVLDTFLINGKNESKAWRYKAMYIYRLGKKQQAIEILDSAYISFPNDTALIQQRDNYSIEYLMPSYLEALRQFNANNYKEAIRLFENNEAGFEQLGGHNRFPQFLEIWSLCHLSLKEYPQGKAILYRILKEDPNHYPSLSNLGYITFHLEKNYEDAISFYTRCIMTDSPDYFLVYNSLGSLYIIQDQPDLAIDSYENALRYGSSKEIYGNLYLLWQTKNNTQKAEYYKALMDKE